MTRVLGRVKTPADLRGLDNDDLAALATEIRDLLIETASRTAQGHLGPNLGVVELTIALHRVFDSPTEPILFDVGHQSYVHKILTGRADQMPTLRQDGGLSGYPSRAESPHDWIENSHASTALSYADGLAKAYDVRGERRTVVAVVGDGALTGGMCWEALNNIAASGRPVIVVVNDNGRSYSPTVGGLADRLATLRLKPGYERTLNQIRDMLERTPVVGPPIYEALHGVKRGIKDMLAPQGMFEDLGLKYIGPVDGHDVDAMETAFTLARGFDAPVIVHCVTRKGYGYAPAENDEADQLHQWRPVDPATGLIKPATGRSWTMVYGEELVRIGERRDDVVAITAAMCDPVGMGEFAKRFPRRFYDVGIAEQHAMTSAAGLAYGGLHPVLSLYATFLNRAFDQLLMDVALHRLPVTVVLDRAGITGSDGPSHNGMWDLALLGVVPGLRLAVPRDADTLRELLNEAVAISDGPTVLRFSKGAVGEPVPALRRVGEYDVLAEPATDNPDGAAGSSDAAGAAVDVLLVAVGAVAPDVLAAAAGVRRAGYSVRVIGPRWVNPVDPAIVGFAQAASLVVTIEDGVVRGGVGARISQTLRDAECDVPARDIGIPVRFLEHGSVASVRAAAGLSVQDIGRRIVEWAAKVSSRTAESAEREPHAATPSDGPARRADAP